jgi:hypothetical protein
MTIVALAAGVGEHGDLCGIQGFCNNPADALFKRDGSMQRSGRRGTVQDSSVR